MHYCAVNKMDAIQGDVMDNLDATQDNIVDKRNLTTTIFTNSMMRTHVQQDKLPNEQRVQSCLTRASEDLKHGLGSELHKDDCLRNEGKSEANLKESAFAEDTRYTVSHSAEIPCFSAPETNSKATTQQKTFADALKVRTDDSSGKRVARSLCRISGDTPLDLQETSEVSDSSRFLYAPEGTSQRRNGHLRESQSYLQGTKLFDKTENNFTQRFRFLRKESSWYDYQQSSGVSFTDSEKFREENVSISSSETTVIKLGRGRGSTTSRFRTGRNIQRNLWSRFWQTRHEQTQRVQNGEHLIDANETAAGGVEWDMAGRRVEQPFPTWYGTEGFGCAPLICNSSNGPGYNYLSRFPVYQDVTNIRLVSNPVHTDFFPIYYQGQSQQPKSSTGMIQPQTDHLVHIHPDMEYPQLRCNSDLQISPISSDSLDSRTPSPDSLDSISEDSATLNTVAQADSTSFPDQMIELSTSFDSAMQISSASFPEYIHCGSCGLPTNDGGCSQPAIVLDSSHRAMTPHPYRPSIPSRLSVLPQLVNSRLPFPPRRFPFPPRRFQAGFQRARAPPPFPRLEY